MQPIDNASSVLSAADRRFLRGFASHLLPPHVRVLVDVDVAANLERMTLHATPGHRRAVRRLVRSCRFLAMLYRGSEISVHAARSRSVAVQRLSRALVSLCLVAFWADDRARALIDVPERGA